MIKTAEEIQKMKVAGRLAAEVLEMITPHVKAGVTTETLDKLCHDYIIHTQKAVPACLNYKGYPKTICTSVNHVICHGIPSSAKILKKGDILNIDVVVQQDGYHGDTSKMFLIGETSVLAQRLTKITYEALWQAIAVVKPGIKVGDLGYTIQHYAEQHGFSVVREYCGHGLGQQMHDDTLIIPHFGRQNTGLTLEAGMTFTIEPMLNAGKADVKLLPDGWTVVTKDHSLSAQWEHTILVTETGYEVLTLRSEEDKK